MIELMQSLRWVATNEVAADRIDVPRPRNDDDVKVRVHHAGVCSTDFHIIGGSFGDHTPLTLGHEIAGEVVKVGSAVNTVKVGDRVALQPTIFCGQCDPCRRGLIHLCPNRQFTGLHRDGGFADYLVAPQVNWVPVPAHVPLNQACLTEPLACVIHALDFIDPQPDQTVCLTGAGTSAFLFMRAMMIKGLDPKNMLVTGRRRARLSVLGNYGVRTVDTRTEELEPAVRDHFGDRGPDIFIDMTGQEKLLNAAVEWVARQGVLFVYAYMPGACPFDFGMMQLCEVKVLTSTGTANRMDEAIRWLADGTIDLTDLVTHHFSIDEMDTGFRHAGGKDEAHVKTVFDLIPA